VITAKGRRSGTVFLLIGCGLFMSPVQAVNTGTGTFTATIAPGTCDLTWSTTGTNDNDVDLGAFDGSGILAPGEMLNSESQPQSLMLACGGYTSSLLTPTLTVTGNAVPGSGSKGSLFRDSAGGNNPSSSLGFEVKVDKAGTQSPNWAGIDPMTDSVPVAVMGRGDNPDGATLPMRFAMSCRPAAGKTFTDCQKAGEVRAALTFTLDYQ
jgi:type 1 fimbria pilin